MSEIELFLCIKMDLALNNIQWLICHQTKPNQTKMLPTNYSLRNHMYLIYKKYLELDNQQGLICHKRQPNQLGMMSMANIVFAQKLVIKKY